MQAVADRFYAAEKRKKPRICGPRAQSLLQFHRQGDKVLKIRNRFNLPIVS